MGFSPEVGGEGWGSRKIADLAWMKVTDVMDKICYRRRGTITAGGTITEEDDDVERMRMAMAQYGVDDTAGGR